MNKESGKEAAAARKRKLITLDRKMEVISKYENGYSKATIGRQFGMNESTVRSILSKAELYKKKGESSGSFEGMLKSRNRSAVMIEVERRLAIWIEYWTSKNIPLTDPTIRTEALKLYETVKENEMKNDPAGVTEETFVASTGWLQRFKRRRELFKQALLSHSSATHLNSPAKDGDSRTADQVEITRAHESIESQMEDIFSTPEVDIKEEPLDEDTSNDESRVSMSSVDHAELKQDIMQTDPESSITTSKSTIEDTNLTNIYKKRKLDSLNAVKARKTRAESPPNDDELDLFGKFIASQLRPLSIQRLSEMQMKIQKLIWQQRLEGELTTSPDSATSSDQQKEQIISFVKENPVLYDTSHDSHSDKKLIDTLWGKIANQVNISATNCRSEWNVLHTRFQLEMQKDKSEASGLPWFPLMKFLLESSPEIASLAEKTCVNKEPMSPVAVSSCPVASIPTSSETEDKDSRLLLLGLLPYVKKLSAKGKLEFEAEMHHFILRNLAKHNPPTFTQELPEDDQM